MSEWTIQDSAELYQVEGWGEPYFKINEKGHIAVLPRGEAGGELDLFNLVQDIQKRGLKMPLLIRFSDILADRIARLNECFIQAIKEYDYKGDYKGVYPVKVNQQRHVVEEVVEFGRSYQFGLEAGSKPELLIALATLKTPGALIICNGYKDSEYIETALLAQRLGHTPFVVIERFHELTLLIEAAQKLGIQPLIGVRAKLTARGIGRWGDSTGDRAKFGLSADEIMEVVAQLKKANLLSSLQLLHFHIGSQISAINVIKTALREASCIYVELARMGAPMQYCDVGGGLAIDYDGSKTNFRASKNYNMQEYAYDVVAAFQEACREKNVTVPTLVSESGRAITSHQSVLVFDVMGVSHPQFGEPQPAERGEHSIIRNLYETYTQIASDNVQEAFNDASQFKEEALSLFALGYLSLGERARVERLYWGCCQKILGLVRELDYIPDELADLEKNMASTYYCNFSVFQSVPDSWAIDQLFPIAPIQRLDEEPTVRGTLADLTCDSDGKIDQFIDLRDVKSVLELHPLREGEPYYLALFLNGAYQEILGDMHNLFGDTNAVHIRLASSATGEQSYLLEHVVKGDTMTEVLRYVQYDHEALLESIRRESEQALRERRITLSESRLLLQHYERSLSGYTYLTSEPQRELARS
ncbi:biosynthetic arginine decarboxylase [Gloeobacter kilaueensis]|uniref:Biosynthetic arginine decarboxylase n=1 Tax=Gloeobacter kilaueensis (strain ATCC BAA-2537 / CCAP 1431/1 / ULC 316 / JS1) TaxID=1183438 RepID=U5QGY8_GLOK1|nr:biosynthetic arginine decarboxylase [Gloeobacter kilaueensis]AGY58242.1 arginine decarboxylase [Gloeobacter kilaueensis JS1]